MEEMKYNNVIKIKSEDLANSQVKGNFLYEENGKMYFTDKFCFSYFEYDKDYKNYDKTLSYNMNFDDYVQKFLSICSKVKNKPSLLFFNYVPKNSVKILNGQDEDYNNNYNFLTDLSDDENFEKFNSSPSIASINDSFNKTLAKLIEKRSECTPQNDIFVFINEPEFSNKLKEFPSLEFILTFSRSRKIYFVFNIVNKSKFIEIYGPELYNTIEVFCQIKFVCNYEGVVDIQPF